MFYNLFSDCLRRIIDKGGMASLGNHRVIGEKQGFTPLRFCSQESIHKSRRSPLVVAGRVDHICGPNFEKLGDWSVTRYPMTNRFIFDERKEALEKLRQRCHNTNHI